MTARRRLLLATTLVLGLTGTHLVCAYIAIRGGADVLYHAGGAHVLLLAPVLVGATIALALTKDMPVLLTVAAAIVTATCFANGLSAVVWPQGTPDYLPLPGELFFSSGPSVANTADVCNTIGILTGFAAALLALKRLHVGKHPG